MLILSSPSLTGHAALINMLTLSLQKKYFFSRLQNSFVHSASYQVSLEPLPADVQGNTGFLILYSLCICLLQILNSLHCRAIQKGKYISGALHYFCPLERFFAIIPSLLYPPCLITEARLKAMLLRSPSRVQSINLCAPFKLIPNPKKSIPLPCA